MPSFSGIHLLLTPAQTCVDLSLRVNLFSCLLLTCLWFILKLYLLFPQLEIKFRASHLLGNCSTLSYTPVLFGLFFETMPKALRQCYPDLQHPEHSRAHLHPPILQAHLTDFISWKVETKKHIATVFCWLVGLFRFVLNSELSQRDKKRSP